MVIQRTTEPKSRMSTERPIPKSMIIINDDKIVEIVRNILNYLSKDTGVVNRTTQEFKSELYTLVLNDMKTKKWYYPGLSLRKLLMLTHAVISNYKFINTATHPSLDSEYDDLCQKKANRLPYSYERFNELRKLLGIA